MGPINLTIEKRIILPAAVACLSTGHLRRDPRDGRMDGLGDPTGIWAIFWFTESSTNHSRRGEKASDEDRPMAATFDETGRGLSAVWQHRAGSIVLAW
jgi:hypothetical protein